VIEIAAALNDTTTTTPQTPPHDNSVDTDLDVDVEIEDSLNTATDSYNSDDDFADLDIGTATMDNLFINSGSLEFDPGDDVNFENVFNGAFSGGGDDNGFAINQVADIIDNDALHNVQQNNGGAYFDAYATAGDNLQANGNSVGASGGDDASGSNGTDGSAHVSANAFNMEVVLGANLQQNAVDATVVGGNNSMGNDSGNDDA
jgi:hypothetical protein